MAAAGRKRTSAPAGSRHRRAHFMRVSTRRRDVSSSGLSDGAGIEVRLEVKAAALPGSPRRAATFRNSLISNHKGAVVI